ncbi:hypothetical protein BDV93DRAFT_557120 [Ceratobasidium sp. AG-I]|nr:hypothetical protein BDV93DRAFT_557120 [Ceratobasidium sp. AG-I]
MNSNKDAADRGEKLGRDSSVRELCSGLEHILFGSGSYEQFVADSTQAFANSLAKESSLSVSLEPGTLQTSVPVGIAPNVHSPSPQDTEHDREEVRYSERDIEVVWSNNCKIRAAEELLNISASASGPSSFDELWRCALPSTKDPIAYISIVIYFSEIPSTLQIFSGLVE